jgi:hypothetical protein
MFEHNQYKLVIQPICVFFIPGTYRSALISFLSRDELVRTPFLDGLYPLEIKYQRKVHIQTLKRGRNDPTIYELYHLLTASVVLDFPYLTKNLSKSAG